jgi:DNA-binding transcriptional regulator YiaG
MARNWVDIRAEALAAGNLEEGTIAEHARRLRSEIRSHRLAEIREDYGLNQGVIAHRLGVSQARVSQIERGDVERSELSTVRAYVAALGGEVEVIAKFGDERITIA